jgi:hypothetical protein
MNLQLVFWDEMWDCGFVLNPSRAGPAATDKLTIGIYASSINRFRVEEATIDP